MKITTALLLPVFATTLAGCATSSTSYTQPTEPRFSNAKLVNRPFDAVWDDLVKALSSDFFVINNIDKNSRLINISFSSQRPSDFVDCGVTDRSFTNAGQTKKYTYKTADSSFFDAADNMGHRYSIRRITRLEGRTNIYVAPENKGTNVTVNTKYVISGTMEAIAADGRPSGSENFTFDPTTRQSYSNGEVVCYARGLVEERILRAAL